MAGLSPGRSFRALPKKPRVISTFPRNQNWSSRLRPVASLQRARRGIEQSFEFYMQLKVLARAITPRRVIGSLDREVESIAYDSRRVQSNTLFVAIRGEKSDGHQFVDQAIEQGASVIVAEREISSPRATCFVVDDSRSALADLSAAFYGMPAHKLKMAAVTGTNGKTTTTFLIKHICERAGMRCGLLGTVQYEIGDRILPAIRTTPEALDIQELLAQIVNAGGRAAAMEVSSHALAQDRTRGIEWDVAVVTNLTQDQLDFHRPMENYFEAKAKLFHDLASQSKKKKAKIGRASCRERM